MHARKGQNTKQSGKNATSKEISDSLIYNHMLQTLESVPLFRDVDEDTLQLLDPLFEPYECTAGTVIFEQGQPAHYLYLLLEGAVEIIYKPYDGPPLTVSNLGQSTIFGWSAAIGNKTYTSGAICRGDCKAIRLSNRDLHNLCAKEPEAGRIILNLLAESVSPRWLDAQSQIQLLLNDTVSARQCAKTRTKRKRKETR